MSYIDFARFLHCASTLEIAYPNLSLVVSEMTAPNILPPIITEPLSDPFIRDAIEEENDRAEKSESDVDTDDVLESIGDGMGGGVSDNKSA